MDSGRVSVKVDAALACSLLHLSLSLELLLWYVVCDLRRR